MDEKNKKIYVNVEISYELSKGIEEKIKKREQNTGEKLSKANYIRRLIHFDIIDSMDEIPEDYNPEQD